MKYMIQLDGLRFIAVFLVMFGHWINPPFLDNVNWFLASSGVNLFFVLSGFLITGILLKDNTLSIFYTRRFLRIFPLYYLVIFIGVLLYIPYVRGDFWWLVSYTSNWKTSFNGGYLGEYSHLWSLGVEEQFYILFPFLMQIRKKYLLKVFLSLIALAILTRCLSFLIAPGPDLKWFSYQFTTSCFDCFGAGAVLAYLRQNQPAVLQRWLDYNKLFITSLVISIILFFTVDRIVLPRLFFAIFCFWLIGKASYNQFNGWFLENRIVIYMGKITYGLYVYHYFMPYLYKTLFNLEGMKYAPLYFITTVAVASLSWFLFEQPINNFKKWFPYGVRQVYSGSSLR
jgi:peptidoglycan/LPS O-acetylase OafA/YrhL